MVLSCGLWLAVHPRWRGEQVLRALIGHAQFGSSPLARGTVAQYQHLIVGSRFIPAGAGNRTTGYSSSPMISVHPRWRGEQL